MIDVHDLLKSKGLRYKETIEEYTDHFCTLFEEHKETYGEAQAAIYTQIAINRLDHKSINTAYFNLHYKKKLIMLSSVISLLCLLFSIQYSIDPPTISPIAITTDNISSHFGMRNHPILKMKKMHTGIDLKAALGEEVKTTANGVVMIAKYDEKYGYFIEIKHGKHFTTRYHHLSEILVTENDVIKVGDVIGKVGSSGLSTSPHLHYEVLEDGKHVDPIQYLKS